LSGPPTEASGRVRLAPIDDPEALAAFAQIPREIMAQAGRPPRWGDLIGVLRAAPERQPMLTRALAWGLPPAQSLWWACLAARLEEILSGRSQRSQALVLAERWIREGEEPVRYEAFQRAREESALGAAPLVGMAAFVAGPSLGPLGGPEEKPPADLARNSTVGALTTAAAAPALKHDGFRLVNSIGLDIAAGGDGREAARRALAAASAAPAVS
jgi:hypothetical protein